MWFAVGCEVGRRSLGLLGGCFYAKAQLGPEEGMDGSVSDTIGLLLRENNGLSTCDKTMEGAAAGVWRKKREASGESP